MRSPFLLPRLYNGMLFVPLYMAYRYTSYTQRTRPPTPARGRAPRVGRIARALACQIDFAYRLWLPDWCRAFGVGGTNQRGEGHFKPHQLGVSLRPISHKQNTPEKVTPTHPHPQKIPPCL